MPVRTQTIAEIPGKMAEIAGRMPEIPRMRFSNVFKHTSKEVITITFFARDYLFTREITFFCVKMDDNKNFTTNWAFKIVFDVKLMSFYEWIDVLL